MFRYIRLVYKLTVGGVFTRKRILNLLRNGVYYVLNIPPKHTYPSLLIVEPSGVCNLRCPLCPTGAKFSDGGTLTRKRGQLSLANFKKILDKYEEHALICAFIGYGEPFINPDLCELIAYAKKKKLYTQVVTNGHFIADQEIAVKVVKSGLDSIVFSVDGADQKSYEQYRVRGDLERVKSSISNMASARKLIDAENPTIEIRTILTPYTLPQREELFSMSKKLGADKVFFKTINLENRVNSDQETKNRFYLGGVFSRYIDSVSLKSRNKIKNECQYIWFSIGIASDGMAAPCGYMIGAPGLMELGNELEDINNPSWTNATTNSFRRKILSEKSSIEECKNCTGKLSAEGGGPPSMLFRIYNLLRLMTRN
ncbi:MAG: radical SAM protein [Oligoflexia bacterium]|nr:radical SAM protein [Oligoflexia bacterium]